MSGGEYSYARYLDGDDDGLVELIREYKDGLIFYINGIVSDFGTAEELTEDTFLRLVTKRPKYNGKASFKTWIYTIAHNIAVDWVRRHRRTVSLDESLPADDEESLERSYIRSERDMALRRAMRKLTSEQRQAIWLVYFEGMSCRDAAAVMGKNTHAVESLLSRARSALGEILEKEGFRYEDV